MTELDDCNELRRAAERSRERACQLEQAISWCRGRIAHLENREGGLAIKAQRIIDASMRAFLVQLADQIAARAADSVGQSASRALIDVAEELRATSKVQT